jgi:hypothetical protein
MFASAVIHLIVLAVYYIKTQDAAPLNFFSVVGLNLFFPSIVYSPFAGLYSLFATATLYFIILYFITQKKI